MNDAMQAPSHAQEIQDILAPTQPEGATAVLRTWLKHSGDAVRKNEPVAELETDKVVVEVFAPCDGVLQIITSEDTPVQSDTVLGRVTTQTTHPHIATEPNHDLRLSPVVRRLVAQHDIDPTQIQGTGRNGRLTREDVLKAVAAQAQTNAQHAAHTRTDNTADTTPAVHTGSPTTTATITRTHSTAAASRDEHAVSPTQVPHSPMRRHIAQHMQQSLASAPHVTAVFEADVSAILQHRAQHKPQFAQQGVNLTLTAYFVSAAATAMRDVPEVNSRWRDDYLEVHQKVNVGIGTALGEQGLIVPVIHSAQNLSLLGIATRLQTLTQAARSGTLSPQDVQHGTFTISNYGGSGALVAAPIILNQGQAGILGIGAIQKRVIVTPLQGVDSLQIRPMAYVSLTIDHRVLNGDQANAWLTRFVQVIEGWT